MFLAVNGVELLFWRKARGISRRDVGRGQFMQGRHPDHEEFINVTLGDSKEVRPFQQRVADIGRLTENPAIKINPAEFPVDVVFWL